MDNNRDSVTQKENIITTIDLDQFRFFPLTDRDLSMMGEARHKTIRGKGVVGRLIDKIYHDH